MFITSSSSFHGFIRNQFNDLLPVGLLAELVERCTGIAEVKGSNPVQAWFFFRFSFRNCKSCVFNCDDLHSYNSSLRSSHIRFSYIHNFRIKLVYSFNNIRRTFETSKTTIYRPHTPYDTMASFITTTRILQGVPFLCKLRLLSFKSRWDYQI